MTLKVYNTLTKQKETFVPREAGKVGIYVCGVTPYNYPHIGNARPFMTWDVIRRYLEYLGYDVLHIQNFTDIDDKIINVAKQEGREWHEIAERYIQAYFQDMDALNIKRAHRYPRVSEHIDDIITIIQGLVAKGYAYAIDGDVYYNVTKFAGYGKLSGRSLEEMKAGARVEVDERKRHPMDFALWKAAKPGEPAWPSPWGDGRPGWHIECSAMSLKYLGAEFDFHGGGSDLIFPHHENELAQSEAYTGTAPFVRYWLHNGFITVKEEKMAKSLGNFFLVRDILAQYPPMVLRFFLLSTHYRSPLDFSEEKMAEAARAWERLENTRQVLAGELRALPAPGTGPVTSGEGKKLEEALAAGKSAFLSAMDDDFNSALAIAALFDIARGINAYISQGHHVSLAERSHLLYKAWQMYTELSGVLGFDTPTQASGAADAGLVNDLMTLIIDVRQQARQKKDWAVADAIRDRLQQLGIVLEDTPQGPRWKKR